MKKDKHKQKEDSKKLLITLNEGRSVFVYEGKDVDFIQSSNVPYLNVEDHTTWKSYEPSTGNPNLIGQIHLTNDGVKFHLCFDSNNRFLGKDELKAIIKGIEYIESFVKQKGW